MKPTSNIARWAVNALLTVTAFLCFLGLLSAAACMGRHFEHYWWMLGGIAVYALLARYVGNWRDGFMLTILHESMHFAVGMFFGRRFSEFVVNDDGSGHVSYAGKRNIFITLAPYCLLLLPLLLLAVKMLFPHSAQWFTALVGFTLAFHCHAVFTQLRLEQTDLQNIGIYRSISFIITFFSLCLGVILYGVYMGLGDALGEFFASIGSRLLLLVGA